MPWRKGWQFLTLGLEDDPPAAVARAIGLVEQIAGNHDAPHPFQGTIATTDGESIWAFRYSSEHNSRSLFYTTDIPTLRKLYPDRQLFQHVSDNARLIVSEPLGDVAGVWNEVPESSWGVVSPDRVDMQPFVPGAPAAAAPVTARLLPLPPVLLSALPHRRPPGQRAGLRNVQPRLSLRGRRQLTPTGWPGCDHEDRGGGA